MNLSAVNEVRSASNLLDRVIADAEKRRNAVIDAANVILTEEAGKVLENVDVDELNRDKQGIRVSALKAAGYKTVYDLMKLPLSKLNAVSGIGQAGAKKINELVQGMVNDLTGGCELKLSVDNKTPESSALVKALYLYLGTEEVEKDAVSLYQKTHESIAGAGEAVRPLESFFSRLFLSGEKRETAENAAAYFESLKASGYIEDVKDLRLRFLNARKEPVTDSTAWEDFEKNAAAYFAVLDSLGLMHTNSEGYMPEELRKEIEKVPLSLNGLKCTLRSYQYFGVQYVMNRGAVLLGDEMGLGKTVQAIAAMVSLRESGKTHFMVVCPASVLVNWCREIAQHSDLVPIRIHGDIHTAINEWLSNGGVGVATYESISGFALPAGFTYGLLVADEAHYVKNPNALRTKALIRLRKSAERVLFMTGTPLENNVDEMCFLISQLQPDIAKQIATKTFLSTAPKFREEVSPVYFRRTREDVLTELPELIETEAWVEMTAEEKADQLKCAAARDFAGMRQVSWRNEKPAEGSKGKRLLEIVAEAESEGRKVLIFSFFLHTLAAVKDMLGEKCFGPVTGAVAPQKRQEIVDAYTAAAPGAVLAAQIQAGGTGLNIQAASVVILCEPQLKPSIENQAISRAYRMGQARSVLVYRLLCENSIDERIMDILSCKQEIFDNFAEESVSGEESLHENADALLTLSEGDLTKAMEETAAMLGGTAGDYFAAAEEPSVIALPDSMPENGTEPAPGDDSAARFF